jgi:hypothetical protein
VLVLLLSYADSEAGRPPDEQRLAAIRRRAEEELLQLKVSLHRHRLQQARILYLAGMFFAAYVVGALTFLLPRRNLDSGLAGRHFSRSGAVRISTYFRTL